MLSANQNVQNTISILNKRNFRILRTIHVHAVVCTCIRMYVLIFCQTCFHLQIFDAGT